jgi:hypothetical protein
MPAAGIPGTESGLQECADVDPALAFRAQEAAGAPRSPVGEAFGVLASPALRVWIWLVSVWIAAAVAITCRSAAVVVACSATRVASALTAANVACSGGGGGGAIRFCSTTTSSKKMKIAVVMAKRVSFIAADAPHS